MIGPDVPQKQTSSDWNCYFDQKNRASTKGSVYWLLKLQTHSQRLTFFLWINNIRVLRDSLKNTRLLFIVYQINEMIVTRIFLASKSWMDVTYITKDFIINPQDYCYKFLCIEVFHPLSSLQLCKFSRQSLCQSYVCAAEGEKNISRTISVQVLTSKKSFGRIKPFPACPRAKNLLQLL